MATKVASIIIPMDKERDTKNTVRFAESVTGGEDAKLETLYVPKTTLDLLGNPDQIVVTIEAV